MFLWCWFFKFWKKAMKKWMEHVLKITSLFVVSVTLIWGQPLQCISTVSCSYLSLTLIGQKSFRLVKIFDLYDFTCIHVLSVMKMCSIIHLLYTVSWMYMYLFRLTSWRISLCPFYSSLKVWREILQHRQTMIRTFIDRRSRRPFLS